MEWGIMGSIVAAAIKPISSFIAYLRFEEFEKQAEKISHQALQFSREEIDKMIILVAKNYSVQAVSFTNKPNYLAFFNDVENLFTKIDRRKLPTQTQKQQWVQQLLECIPNNLQWLISIYCVQQGEQRKLSELWRKYATLICLKNLHSHSMLEFAEIPNEEFAETYISDHVETQKVDFANKLDWLGKALEKALGVSYNNRFS